MKGDEQMMGWKGFGRRQTQPNLKYYPGIRLEGLKKPLKSSLTIAGLRAEI
jgi:hypothetical protein